MHHMTHPSTLRQRTAGIAAALVFGLMLLALPALASAKDRNNDRIPDRWEKRHGLSLKVNQAQRDQDRDQLTNRREFRAGMDPHDSDSDDDGVEDSDEGAGTIASYDETTGELTVDLFGGGSITGLVTDATEIDCDDGDDHGDEDGDGDGGDVDEDHSGPGHDGDDDVEEDHSGSSDDDDVDVDEDHSGSSDDGSAQLLHSDDTVEEDDTEVECSTADLIPGAVVQEAELELENGAATFEEIELLV